MTNPAVVLIEQCVSANLFDTGHTLSDTEIEELARLATRAPTAYKLQNWRFIALRTHETKMRLRRLAYGQATVSDAAVTFIICGQLPDHATVSNRLLPFVEAGYMQGNTASSWQENARAKYANPQTARDEAVRSATLCAATLIYAAEVLGLVSSHMIGFDAEGVIQEFSLGPDEVPVMLVAVGRTAPGNRPQKPRRPVADVPDIL